MTRRPTLDRSRVARAMSDRDLRHLVLAALDRGWTARLNGSTHVRLTHPSGATVSTSTTRGGRGRGTYNLRAAIARVERAERA